MLETLDSSYATQRGKNAMTESISRKDAAPMLAGMIEGEGCIYAYFKKQTNPHARQGTTLKTAVTIWNTHPLFVRRATECLISLEVPFTLSLSNNSGKRCGIQIVVEGRGRLKKLLPQIIPHLASKQKQAKLLLGLIEYRDSLVERYQAEKGTFSGMFLKDDTTIQRYIEEMKEEKHNYPSVLSFTRRPNSIFGSEFSETTRLPSQEDDIVRTAWRHAD